MGVELETTICLIGSSLNFCRKTHRQERRNEEAVKLTNKEFDEYSLMIRQQSLAQKTKAYSSTKRKIGGTNGLRRSQTGTYLYLHT